MQNQELKLDYIECGRMSENEMSNIFAGVWTCSEYHACGCTNKGGKSSCIGGYQNCSTTDPYSFTTCRTQYSWMGVLVVDTETETESIAY